MHLRMDTYAASAVMTPTVMTATNVESCMFADDLVDSSRLVFNL